MKILINVLLVIVLVAFLGCQSANLYERQSSDDCLILIPTILRSPETVRNVRGYSVRLSDGRSLRIPQKNESYVPIVVSNDKVSIVSISSRIEDTGYVGDAFEVPVNFPLPYERGMVVILDYTFVQAIERVRDGSYSISNGFIHTTAAKRQSIMDMFRRNRNSAIWLND